MCVCFKLGEPKAVANVANVEPVVLGDAGKRLRRTNHCSAGDCQGYQEGYITIKIVLSATIFRGRVFFSWFAIPWINHGEISAMSLESWQLQR